MKQHVVGTNESNLFHESNDKDINDIYFDSNDLKDLFNGGLTNNRIGCIFSKSLCGYNVVEDVTAAKETASIAEFNNLCICSWILE